MDHIDSDLFTYEDIIYFAPRTNYTMKNLSIPVVIFLLLSTLTACRIQRHADTVLYNGRIYTVDNGFSIVEAIAIRDGKIVAIGSSADLLDEFIVTEKIDLDGKAVFPGFIDAHCHFYGYGTDLLKCDLYGTKSFDEIIGRMQEYSTTNKFSWELGRGWDQNDWDVKEYPTNEKLDSLFPDKPVFLMRIDGHAALCNSAALKLAGITIDSKVTGGEFLQANGKLTGLLIDNAIEAVRNKIPPFSDQLIEESILKAQANCFEVGLTTVDDAGIGKDTIIALHKMQQSGKLKMRIYAMISNDSASIKHFVKHGPYKNDRMNVRAIKIYADGALGSRGACMKQEYSDQKGHFGFMLYSEKYMNDLADEALENGFQLCAHAIGDSANKVILNIYKDHLSPENNKRWRIEHCQVVDENDRKLFATCNIIPSVQPTHATSDMYWVEERIGKERMPHAYAYKSLKDEALGMMAFGTDFPVEGINPLNTFYAAIYRRDHHDFPEGGFLMGEKIKRKDALRAMTIMAAYANFEEEEKGSLEEGKFADLVILDQDIMKIDEKEILNTKVVATYVNGEKVFGK
jgi:predicted amidohydrolase YtcJ